MAGSMGWLEVSSFIFGLSTSNTMMYGVLVICCAKEFTVALTDCKSCRADPATTTTEQVFGVTIPWMPRVRW